MADGVILSSYLIGSGKICEEAPAKELLAGINLTSVKAD
jgi:hypothetical protein